MFCPGELNIADLPSRGCTGAALIKNDEWFHGPKFLKLSEENWPKPPRCNGAESEIALSEMVRRTLELSADELIEAEQMWIKDIQNNMFPEEVKQLINRTKTSSSRLHQLRLFLDDKVMIRCEGRIEHSPVSSEAKKAVFIPAKHHVTDLIIQEHHDSANDTGIKGTLNRIRERYWILHGRQAIKRVLRKYVTCKPYPTPKTPHLPSWRTSNDTPFSYTGVDFAGPLNVKENSKCGQQSTKKSYIALFTRAKELSKIKRSPEVQQQHLANNGVSWKFIVEKAPWRGVFWKRLIKSVKRCLKKSIDRATLSLEELRTILIEIESTLNSHPITYIYDDEEGISYPLTPSCLLYGRRTTTTPNDSQFEIVSTNESLTRRAQHQKILLKEFTKQWRREYY
ncbi:Hypothetical predicted protein [Paramuricea clavata]|uniref:Integrase zinc-binding domain-containing protein n=1 Tax=Paramuricea clavata TaxID=317549 RepID=A0A6S7HDX7_PARCT|nr:Hypothetical predicted protein [Paramuricea clavata]